MQDFGTLRQPLLLELAMSWRERGGGEKNAIYSGHLRLCLQPKGSASTPLGPKYLDEQWLSCAKLRPNWANLLMLPYY